MHPVNSSNVKDNFIRKMIIDRSSVNTSNPCHIIDFAKYKVVLSVGVTRLGVTNGRVPIQKVLPMSTWLVWSHK